MQPIATTKETNTLAHQVQDFLLEKEEGERFTLPTGEVMEVIHQSPKIDHFYAPGLYMRSIYMTKGMLVVGAEYNHQHMVIIPSGLAEVLIEGEWQTLRGPCEFVSTQQMSKRMLKIHEDMQWITVHPNPDNCTDPDILLERLTVQSPKSIQEDAALRRKAALNDQQRQRVIS
jgi:hypothetical protein